MPIWQVILLGLVEGLTEFIPVSSTGHLLLLQHMLGFSSPGRTFEVLIQLGAILALLSVYAAKLWQLARALPSDPRTQKFVLGILLAFLPAAIIGAAGHKIIKTILFESPLLVSSMLVIGGVILLAVDRMKFTPRYTDVLDLPPTTALAIGLCQCLALIPGRIALWLHDRGCAVPGNGQAHGSRVLVLSRNADHGGRVRLRPLQELGHPVGG